MYCCIPLNTSGDFGGTAARGGRKVEHGDSECPQPPHNVRCLAEGMLTHCGAAVRVGLEGWSDKMVANPYLVWWHVLRLIKILN